MIIIQAEDGAIVTDPKKIYIDNDLDGHLHIYADLSSTAQVKAVKLTVGDYSKEALDQALKALYKVLASGFSRTDTDTTPFVWKT